MIPVDVRSRCELCGTQVLGVEAIVAHLETVHGEVAQRWPDGELVMHMSDVPELMEER